MADTSNIGTAYVKIIPTATGISSSIENELSDEGQVAGGHFSGGFSKAMGAVGKAALAAVAAAATATVAIVKQAVESFGEYEQLAGGAEKIFADMDTSQIFEDAAEAYKTLGISANEYLSTINDVGATFAATMGAEAGYNNAVKGLQAISDYASGTGKDIDTLSEKFTLITRSTSSYQSIADQFSGILPATSAAFLEQAKAAGYLAEEYTSLTDVPIEEYQAAVTSMLEDGVAALNLTGNTAAEAEGTLTGSFAMLGAAWKNLVTGIADENADLDGLIQNVIDSFLAVVPNIVPTIKTALKGVGKLVSELAPMIAAELPSMLMEIITDFSLLMTEQLPVIIDSLLVGIVGILNELSAQMPVILPTLIQAIMDSVISILENLPGLLDGILSLVTSIVDVLLNDGLPIILDALPYILDAIIVFIGEGIGSILEAVGAIIQAIADAFPDFMVSIIPLVIGLIGAVVDALIESSPEFVSGFVQLFAAVIALFPEITAEFCSLTPEFMQAVIDSFLEWTGNIAETGKGLMTELANGFTDGSVFTALKENISEIDEKCSEFFGDVWDNFKEWGKNLMTGLVEGIKDKLSVVSDTVSGICANITTEFTDFFGIASPSKLFGEYGGYIDEGLAKGIINSQSVVDEAIAGLNTNIVATADAGSWASSAADSPVVNNDAELALLSEYLPYLASGQAINISLEGDAQGIFKLMQKSDREFRRQTGHSAFA